MLNIYLKEDLDLEEEILAVLEGIKFSIGDVESKTGWVETNTLDTVNKLDEILNILKKIERKL